MKKKIGVLGSGVVGPVLANGFIKHGYDVTVGTNHPEKLKGWEKAAREKGKIGSFEEAARFAEIVVLAVKGTAATEVLRLAGAENLAGKTVLDATNPIADIPPQDGVLKFFTNFDESLMERLQKQVPCSRFVKAFSCVGNALMVNPDFNGIRPTMFICGSDPEAKKEAAHILNQFGWDVEDMGGVAAARAIEPLAILWCIPGFTRNQWSHAFKLLRK